MFNRELFPYQPPLSLITEGNAKPFQKLFYLAENNEDKDQDILNEENQSSNLCLYPERDCKPTDENRIVEDFQINVAQKLLAQAHSWRRMQILANAGNFFTEEKAKQEVLAQHTGGLPIDQGEPATGHQSHSPSNRAGIAIPCRSAFECSPRSPSSPATVAETRSCSSSGSSRTAGAGASNECMIETGNPALEPGV
jgi:hypothetical protein